MAAVSTPSRRTGRPSGPAQCTSHDGPRPLRVGVDGAPAVAIAVALGLVAFLTAGGVALEPNTWTEIALALIGTGLGVWALVSGIRLPGWGVACVALFAAVAALTALSVAWSVAPDTSWIEAGRTLGYLAAFGGAAVLARRFGDRWAPLLGGIALFTVAIALWTVMIKVFGWGFDQQTAYGRLVGPLAYWNATGSLVALGLAPVVWAGSRRGAGRVARSLAVPAITLLGTVVVLSYSRSALAAAILGLAVPLAFSDTKLRGALTLALGAAGTAVVCGWALSDHSLTADLPITPSAATLSARSTAGHTLGLVLAIALVAFAAVGWGAAVMADRRSLSTAQRRRTGTVLVGLLGLVPIGAVLALFASRRGFTGEISHVWNSLTSPGRSVGFAPSRLTDLANSRPDYWRQGITVGAHHLLAGVGAGGFGAAHLRYPNSLLISDGVTAHAHSYLVQTFADLGLIGLVLSLALFAVWLLATRRVLARPGGAGAIAATVVARLSAERDGLLAVVGVVVAYGVSSALDWTWFFPGVTVPALVCAGWLAGRGPLAAPAPSGDRADGSAIRTRAVGGIRPVAVLGATALSVGALVCAYLVWQPLRSADADANAVNEAVHGDDAAALTDARSAVNAFPMSLSALEELAAIQSAVGQPAQARATLLRATRDQPENPAAWGALGEYELAAHRFRLAIPALQREAVLNLSSGESGVDREIVYAVAHERPAPG